MTRTTAPALRRGLDILELFLDSQQPLRVPEMVETLGIPRASVHELVGALVDRGYLRTVGEPPYRYALGVQAFQLGAAYERDMDVARLGREGAARIAAQCGETVQVTLLDQAEVVYIAKIDSTHSIRLVSNLGARLPAHCTAGGKMLLAHLRDEQLDALYPHESLPTMTTNSVSTRTQLTDELAVSKSRGWAEEYCESNEDAACVASSIYNRAGENIASLSISIPTIRWNPESRLRFARLAVEGAEWVSDRLGAPPRSPAVF